MTQEYFEKWNDVAKRMQEPFQAMAELNVKTLQSMHFLKPDELSNVKKPEELIEKQIHIAIENGHKALDYLQKSFQIIEKTMLSLVQEVKNKSDIKK
ncbi:phasin family protein [Legionella jordanis]|uniref:Phasin protein n=1 Tax=Legionella jordanis TaxID=456 RepID=A0A0W0VEG5_9GAMM|nr:phasin family protein [Legionella jordanis]KTD18198.1 Phasin protein [Legionella jordanis]RMX01158.1 phasin family protein [Legionella jordanis]RMX21388.1 phasin family protein [Legionella jordanis]VEH13709.1 Phasin protein [Legionella jordanis]HAT8714580.1 phasin family protein [Legionella jordanis]